MKKILNIGDKIEIIKFNKSEHYLFGFNKEMESLSGQIATIINLERTSDSSGNRYYIDLDNGNNTWSISMFKDETISKNKKEIISYKPGMSITEFVKKLMNVEKDETRKKWLRTFDNCVLPEEVKRTIDEALVVVLRADIFEKWGINEHFEKGLTNSILIYGPSGTGKTMVSESIASILGKNLMKITNADIQSNVPGMTEKNITESFKKAAKEDAVIMLDECDSLLYNRNSVGAILSAEINHLLGEIERFSGVIIMTTNRLYKLDEAMQRRIIAKVELPNPNFESRVNIWEKLIPNKMPVKNLDFKRLAKAELSGGEIKNAILLASRKAISQNKDFVDMEDFEEAVIGVLKSKQDYNDVKPHYHEIKGLDKQRQ